MTNLKDFLAEKHLEKEVNKNFEEWIESISNEDMEHYLYHYIMSVWEKESARIAKVLLDNQ